MDNSPQARYLTEAALQLTRAGFDISAQETNGFQVLFEGKPLCTVSGRDVRYREADVEGERRAVFDKVLEITHTVGEYMLDDRAERVALYNMARELEEYESLLGWIEQTPEQKLTGPKAPVC